MRRLLLLATLVLPGALALPSAHAQPGEAPVALVADDEAEVRAAVARLFDGMRAGDSTAVRAAFHPDAQLLTVVRQGGGHRLIEGDIDEFVTAVGTPHEAVWDERVDEVEVRLDDGLATAWMGYRFYAGEQFSHCGVNAFQLVRTPAGWQTVSIVDTRRPSCE